jgi:hypothetical protein
MTLRRTSIHAFTPSGASQIHAGTSRRLQSAEPIESQHEILPRMREGQNQVEPVLARPQAIAVTDKHSHLNRVQKTVVSDVLSSPDGIPGLQGSQARARQSTRRKALESARSKNYSGNTSSLDCCE